MNAKEQRKSERIKLCRLVIEYLNEQADRGYDPVSKGNLKLFTAEWGHKYGLKQYEGVIDYLVLRWKDDIDMRKFLRPATLFGPEKFPEYLAEARTLIQEEIKKHRLKPYKTYIPVGKAVSDKLIPFAKYEPTW